MIAPVAPAGAERVAWFGVALPTVVGKARERQRLVSLRLAASGHGPHNARTRSVASSQDVTPSRTLLTVP